jgi:hypothetical protein
MRWVELGVLSGLILRGAPLANVQAATPLDALHDGWYFTGTEARTRGISPRTAVAIDCNGTTPRIILDFREARRPPSYGTPEPPTTTATRVTLGFVKHSVLGSLTSMFDQKEQRVFAAKLLSRPRERKGADGLEGIVIDDSLERIVIDGADAAAIATKLKSVDEFTAEDKDLGRGVSFKMTDAKPAIEQVFSLCSSGH